MVSEIEIPAVTIESVSGTNLRDPILPPCEPPSNRIESAQLSLF